MLSLFLIACTSTPEEAPLDLPDKEQRGPFQIVRLEGTPYEMGVQHGELLLEELEEGAEYIASDPLMGGMLMLADQQGLLDFAYEQSAPHYIQECEGMTSVSDMVGWTMDHCILLNFGDVIIERLLNPPEQTPGCSQIVAQREATEEGSMLHGRLLDWEQIDFIIENPTIFVKQPTDGIPHVIIGFPGNLSPYQGMNRAGLSIASNEAHPSDDVPFELTKADSHVQMVGTMLANAQNLDEVSTYISSMHHASTESIVVADGTNNATAVFEMTHQDIDMRLAEQGMVFQTNHFVGEKTSIYDVDPVRDNSQKRFDRIDELLSAQPKLSIQTIQSMRSLRMDCM
ncbi:MAG: hypothetical protein CL916_08565, partial [Deltaproteobacteria bacterium]|nr:hypothetical protein [Deltaproteobacteria bacterium]